MAHCSFCSFVKSYRHGNSGSVFGWCLFCLVFFFFAFSVLFCLVSELI